MATEKIYYQDAHQAAFQARVLSCQPGKHGYDVVLDRTCFYPEGGGQPGDTGFLSGVRVTDTHERSGEIVHFCEQPLAEGQTVDGQIDYERRFAFMQLHSGEHILSGVVHRRFGYENVGFHMGADFVTIDFSGMLTPEELSAVEAEANEWVWKNVPIEIAYPDAEALKTIPYRSKKELPGQVRLVRFPGSDLCACCGTHVTHTGEIGAVKILTVENFHEGIRLTMICGKRVMDYLNMVNDQNRQVSMKLSAKIGETAAAVARLQDENFRLKGQVNHMFDELCTVEAKNWEGAGSVLIFHDGLEADQVRRMADAVMQKCSGCCAVFSANGDGSYKYAIGEQNGDLRQFTKEMNAALNGRGGGKPFFVQGSVKTSEDEIRQFFRQ